MGKMKYILMVVDITKDFKNMYMCLVDFLSFC